MLQQTLTLKAQAIAKQACIARVRNNAPRQSSTALLTINARLLATSAPGSSTWLQATAYNSNSTIDNTSYQLAVRLRLGFAPFDIMPNNCHSCRVYSPANLDLVLQNEWHYLNCMEGHGGREVTLRHDQLVQLLAHYLKLAGAVVVLEPKHAFSETNKRPDLQVVLASKVYLIDVTIVNPTAPSNLRYSQKVLGQASAAEKIKIRKYAELSSQQNCIFIPFVIEVYGGIGKMAQDFLNEVSVFAHDHMTVSSRFDVVNGLKFAIACSVQRGNALIVLGGYANAVRVFGPT
jgi:hypothetical protein